MKNYTPLFLIILFLIIASSCKETDKKKQTIEKTVSSKEETLQTKTESKQLPDFSKYSDIAEKKTAFFSFLKPIVKSENQKILKEREFVLSLYDAAKKDEFTTNENDSIKLAILLTKYRVKKTDFNSIDTYEALIKKVDIIPVDLTLTQAAIESSWGSSYFAKESNNIFGQWCFTPGCGTVPREREEGATHEVANYESVNQAVGAYMRNLNAHPAYAKLRDIRLEARNNDLKPNGKQMALGLLKYSGIGMEYVEMIQDMIAYNKKYMGLDSNPQISSN